MSKFTTTISDVMSNNRLQMAFYFLKAIHDAVKRWSVNVVCLNFTLDDVERVT